MRFKFGKTTYQLKKYISEKELSKKNTEYRYFLSTSTLITGFIFGSKYFINDLLIDRPKLESKQR